MGYKIQLITDPALKKAAQEADSYGEKKHNKTLDESEVSLFLDKAKEKGCNMEEARRIANMAIESSVSPKIVTQDVKDLDKEIQSKEAELHYKQEKLKKMKTSLDGPNNLLMLASCLGSLYLSPAISGALEYLFHWKRSLNMVAGGAGALLCGVGLTLLTAKLTTPNKNSHEYKVKTQELAQQTNEYYEKEIKPLEEEISKLKLERNLLCTNNK